MPSTTAANRYAKALLDVAVKEKADVRQIERELADFAALLKANPPLEQALVNPAIPTARKRAVIVELAGRAQMVPVVAKLLAVLAEHDRLVLVPGIAAAYGERLLDHLKVVRAELTTAVPLAPEGAQAIERSLARLTGRTVILTSRVDPSIIGGVVARIGSTIYDGSVTRQLEKMKQQLVEGA